jgi:hypothetical protein
MFRGPCDAVDREPRRVGDVRRRHARECSDLSVEVRLIGVTDVGGDSGAGLARGEAVGGLIEADEASGVLRCEPDL